MQRAGEGQSRREVRFKENRELAPAVEGIESPYDAEARYRSCYATVWTGYLVHLTETCVDEEVHLITHVQTTAATIHESQQTAAIQQALVEDRTRDIKPWGQSRPCVACMTWTVEIRIDVTAPTRFVRL